MLVTQARAKWLLTQNRLWHDPATGLEWREAEKKRDVVALIADLLEDVITALPERRELDLDSPPCNDTVSFRVASSRDVKPLGRTPSSDELLADGAHLARGSRLDPSKWAARPWVVLWCDVVAHQRC